MIGKSWSLWTLVFSIQFFIGSVAFANPPAAPISCECAESTCGICQIETGVTFYSEKCGPNNSKVKSCKRPTCEPVENQKACLALFDKGSGKEEVATAAAESREPSSVPQVASDGSLVPVAGEIVSVQGAVTVTHVNGEFATPRARQAVYNGDLIETKSDGGIRLRLRDSSELVLPVNSKLRLDKVQINADKRKVMMNLLMGKVRSRVSRKTDEGNTYEIRTRTTVAGVRGTDFVVSFEPGEKEWVSEVRTVEGRVNLQGNNAEKSVEVVGGSFAAFVVPSPGEDPTDAEVDRAISKGFISSVFKIKDEEVKQMQRSLEFIPMDARKITVTRTVASASEEESICTEPAGKFNQCAFKCEGNPAGASTCKTELPTVKCVRRLCNANGQWGEAKRLPASEGFACQPQGTSVQDCGNYW